MQIYRRDDAIEFGGVLTSTRSVQVLAKVSARRAWRLRKPELWPYVSYYMFIFNYLFSGLKHYSKLLSRQLDKYSNPFTGIDVMNNSLFVILFKKNRLLIENLN